MDNRRIYGQILGEGGKKGAIGAVKIAILYKYEKLAIQVKQAKLAVC